MYACTCIYCTVGSSMSIIYHQSLLQLVMHACMITYYYHACIVSDTVYICVSHAIQYFIYLQSQLLLHACMHVDRICIVMYAATCLWIAQPCTCLILTPGCMYIGQSPVANHEHNSSRYTCPVHATHVQYLCLK